MSENSKTDKQIVGKIGEDAVCVYLKKKGFSIVCKNYLKKWGEIDIVAQKGEMLHFVEVKSVTREIKERNVSRETFDGEYRPEDNIHQWKLNRLRRVIQSYLIEQDVFLDSEWQFDVAIVYVDRTKRICRVEMLSDIVL